MIYEISSLSGGVNNQFFAVEFIKGSTRLEITSKPTNHGVVFECSLRFAVVDHSISWPLIHRMDSWRITYNDKHVIIGSPELPAKAHVDSVDPNVYVVKHTAVPNHSQSPF